MLTYQRCMYVFMDHLLRGITALRVIVATSDVESVPAICVELECDINVADIPKHNYYYDEVLQFTYRTLNWIVFASSIRHKTLEKYTNKISRKIP